MSSRGQPQKTMGFVTQRVGSTVSTLCGIAWFAIPGNRSSRRPHGWCEICNELLVLSCLSVVPCPSSSRCFRAQDGEPPPTTPSCCRTDMALHLASSALSHVHLHPHPARDEHCCAHAVLPEQVPGCSAGPFWPGLAWPGLASRLHLHVLIARSALATSPAGRASN